MSHQSYRITLRPDGEMIFHGLEEPPAKLHYRQRNGLIVAHVKGGSYWSGRGQQSYAGAVFRVMQIINTIWQQLDIHTDEYGNEEFRAVQIIEFPVRAKKNE